VLLFAGNRADARRTASPSGDATLGARPARDGRRRARRRSDFRRPARDLASLAKKRVDRGTTDVGQPLNLGLGDARLQHGGQDIRDVIEGLIGSLKALATLRTEPLKLAPKPGALVGHPARSVNGLTNAVVVVNLFTPSNQ
jgi:hypothetical protein